MATTTLIDELTHRMEAANLNAKRLSVLAGLNETAVRDILKGRSRNPKGDTLIRLAQVLRCSVNDLLGWNGPPGAAPEALLRIPVIGAVEAGVWREAFEWEQEDQYAVTVAPDRRYPGLTHFALEVRGTSMDLLYPEGAVLICIRYADLAASPNHGDQVICQRVNRVGLVEATVKELIIDKDGQAWLWPRSHNPRHQQPIALPNADRTFGEATGAFRMPGAAQAGGSYAAEEIEDITLLARVVASYRPE